MDEEGLIQGVRESLIPWLFLPFVCLTFWFWSRILFYFPFQSLYSILFFPLFIYIFLFFLSFKLVVYVDYGIKEGTGWQSLDVPKWKHEGNKIKVLDHNLSSLQILLEFLVSTILVGRQEGGGVDGRRERQKVPILGTRLFTS